MDTYTDRYIDIHACIYTYIYMYIYVHISIDMCTCTYMCIYIYIRISTFMHIYIYANIHTICLWLVPQHKFTIRLIICLPRHAQDCRYKSYKYFCWRVGTHIHAYAKTPTHPPTPHSSNPLFHSHAPSLSERNPSAKNRVQNSHPMRPPTGGLTFGP